MAIPVTMRPFLAATAVLLALALPVASAQWVCHQDPYLLSWDDGSSTYYLISDECLNQHCLFSIWIYSESNGVSGLQRCDEMHGDNCYPKCYAGGDTIVV